MLALLAATLLAATPMTAPSPPDAPPADAFLRQYASTRRFMAGRPVDPQATPDGKEVLFLRSGPTDAVQALHAFDVATGRTRELLTAPALLGQAAQELTPEEKAALERLRISARGFTSFKLSEDGARVLLPLSGKLYVLERGSGKVVQLAAGAGAFDPRFSPDGRHVAYVRDNDVFAVDLASNRERRVTRGGTALVTHGLAEFVAQEEMHRYTGYWWSPDGRSIAFEEADSSALETFTIADPLHPEAGATQMRYPRPGKANTQVRLGVTAASGKGKTVWVAWDREAYPYLATVAWQEGGPLTLLVQNRAQTEQVLLAADPATGKTRTLLVERDAAWLNLDQQFPRWRKDGKGFFWLTERNGAPEVEERGADGALLASRVPPEAGFADWVGYDDAEDALYFTGSPDPTQARLWRVRGEGRPERLPTPAGDAPATEAVKLSVKGRLLLVTASSLAALPRTHVLRLPDFAPAGTLPSVAQEPAAMPATRVQRVGEGEGFWTAVTRPRNAKAGEKLPVILYVYGGPHAQQVKHAPVTLLDGWLAEQGFLVVRADNRGTPRRGRAWERAIKGDFAGPALEDQVAALRALAREVPEVDLARVGVYGWSFGGYMAALSVLARPDVFRAAVAGAPVTEWRDYDTHYTERYLGVPPEAEGAYTRSSLLPLAPALRRPLLLVHGTADDNVHFFHTLKLSDALLRAGRRHDVLPLSGFTHMVADPLVTERLYSHVAAYLREHLAAPAPGGGAPAAASR